VCARKEVPLDAAPEALVARRAQVALLQHGADRLERHLV
jgi:hypothetical protein